MVVAGRVLDNGDVAIMMVEAEATEKTIELVDGGATRPTEEVVAEGLEAAKPFIAELCRAQSELAKVAAKPTAEFPVFLDYQDDVLEAVSDEVSGPLAQALTIADKQEREAELDGLKEQVKQALGPRFEGRENEISPAYRALTKKLVRQRILRDKVRIDGRGRGRHPHPVRRGRGGAAGARFGAVPARRDADPRRHHAEHARHGAEARHAQPAPHQAVHAQLQLPAVLDR